MLGSELTTSGVDPSGVRNGVGERDGASPDRFHNANALCASGPEGSSRESERPVLCMLLSVSLCLLSCGTAPWLALSLFAFLLLSRVAHTIDILIQIHFGGIAFRVPFVSALQTRTHERRASTCVPTLKVVPTSEIKHTMSGGRTSACGIVLCVGSGIWDVGLAGACARLGENL